MLERVEVVIPAFDPNTTPDWLRSALDDTAKLHGPSWIGPGDLLAIVVGEHGLSEPQVDRLLGAWSRARSSLPIPS